jgi:hypothetical protein
MGIQRSAIKTGPAIVIFNGERFHFKSGITINDVQETFEIPVDDLGKVDDRISDKRIEVSGIPAGQWNALSTLFYLAGVDIGTRIHGDTDKQLIVWFKDGSRYTFRNAGWPKPPGLVFRTTETLFKQLSWTCRIADEADPTDPDAYFIRDTAAFSDSSFSSSDVLTQRYRLSWGGDAPWNNFFTQAGVELDFNTALSPIPVDGFGVIDEQLADFSATAKFRPIGIADQYIDERLAFQNDANAAIGSSLNARGEDLILDGSGLYVIIRGAAATKQTREAGMQKIRTGDMEVMATRTFNAGVALPLVYIGASEPV